ncbi:MAG TPA: adenylate/guanylate cyclase domain-containing protein [Stellaceae bacterium]|jgi:class 3 adenylate cyclase
MTMEGRAPTDRRLAAILAADVVGYSRLMGANEEGTHIALKAIWREVTDPKIDAHRGRVVKTMGDGLLVEFASVLDAVRCAVDIQREMEARNAVQAAEDAIVFRIGINVGDIIIDGADIFGDGVNIAARLEGLAAPGGICVSRIVRDQVRDKLGFGFEDMGQQQVKNIARPVHVFRILFADGMPPISGSRTAAGAEDPPAFDKAVFGLCETVALMLALPFGEDLYKGTPVAISHYFYLFIGLLFAFSGPLWPQIHARIPSNVTNLVRARFRLGLVPTFGLIAVALVVSSEISSGPGASPSLSLAEGAETDAIAFAENEVGLPQSADEAIKRQTAYLRSHPTTMVTVRAYCSANESKRADPKAFAELRANRVRDALKARKIAGRRIKIDIACAGGSATAAGDATTPAPRPRVVLIPN